MREQLTAMIKDAMKAGDKRRLGTVRLIQAALKDKEIELRGTDQTLGEAEIAGVLLKMVKQRQDSIAVYAENGREDLATQEREELAIISEFLPKGFTESETRDAIAEAIRESGATGPKDMGKVIASVKAKHAGRIDFSKASGLVKQMLTKLGA